MYQAPPPIEKTSQRERLRRLVFGYALLAGAGVGYTFAGMDRLVILFDDAGSPLAWLGLIMTFVVMYAPFIRTAALGLPRWIGHMRRLIAAVGAGLSGIGVVFALNGVWLPNLDGMALTVACAVFSASITLRFLAQRLELL